MNLAEYFDELLVVKIVDSLDRLREEEFEQEKHISLESIYNNSNVWDKQSSDKLNFLQI